MGKPYPEPRGYLHAYLHDVGDIWLLLHLPSYGNDRHGYREDPLVWENTHSEFTTVSKDQLDSELGDYSIQKKC
jgi:hypothetical protein